MRGRSMAWIAAAYALGGAAAVAAVRLSGVEHPVAAVLLADLAATTAVFLFSFLLDNSSVYDPYWSVAPLPIGLYWAWRAGTLDEPRTWIVLALLAAWGGRLTWNWLRRWRGLSDEDWRYREIRRRCGRLYWPASFLGIHLLPTLLVFLGCLPLFAALSHAAGAPDVPFLAAAAVTAAAVLLESIADRQLWAFLRSRQPDAGFLATGLWGRVRHPNYLGEVLFWWGIWGLGAFTTKAPWWTLIGPVSMTLLFGFVSVPMMDRRMRARHPAYEQFERGTPALLPRIR